MMMEQRVFGVLLWRGRERTASGNEISRAPLPDVVVHDLARYVADHILVLGKMFKL